MKILTRRICFIAAAGIAAGAALLAFTGGASAQENPIDWESCGYDQVEFEGELGASGVGELLYCELTVDKTLESGDPAILGSTVTFEVKVTNTGTLPLVNVGVSDIYDDLWLEFDNSTPEPDFGPEFGVVVWDPLDESGGSSVWEPGDSRTITVRFEAVEVTDDGDAENCALAFGILALKVSDVVAQSEAPEVVSEEDCADVEIIERDDEPDDPQGGPDGFPTPTEEPELPAPTPIVTVAPATVVPAPTATQPAGIVAPDTGAGPGGGASAGTWALAGIAAAAIVVAGAGVYKGKRNA